MTLKQVVSMVELYAGRAGAVKDVIDRNLIIALINNKLDKVIGDGNMSSKDYTFTCDGTAIEYDLPTDVIPYRVIIGGVQSSRVSYYDAGSLIYQE
jgi:hypothetical protein